MGTSQSSNPNGSETGRALEVVVHRHRFAVHGARVERGVAPAVDGECAELFLRGAVEVHVALRVHCKPVRRGVRAVREQRRHVAHHVDHAADAFVALGLAVGRGSAPWGRWSRWRASTRRQDRATHHLHRAVDEHVTRVAVGDGEATRPSPERADRPFPPWGSIRSARRCAARTSAGGVSPIVAIPSMSSGSSPASAIAAVADSVVRSR